MIVTTGNDVAGRQITAYLGVVRGIVVRSQNIAQGLIGGLKQIAGGNIAEYTKVCEQARAEAYSLLVAHAQEVGADAIIAMRYDANEFVAGATEVLAYGTAVKLTPPLR
jgi:uncharacterized protein YbjQ (UPF0145 family)